MIAKVVDYIEKPTSKGGKYLFVKMMVDGKQININSFDDADNVTFRQAKESGQFIVVETTKNDKGYDQITKVQFIAEKIPEAPPDKSQKPIPEVTKKPLYQVKASDEMTKADWEEKDRITRRSIELQKCLEYALPVVSMAIQKTSSALTSTDITKAVIASTKLLHKEIFENPVMTEAKKQGAVEE